MIFGALNEDILRLSKEEHPSNMPFISIIFCALKDFKFKDSKLKQLEKIPFISVTFSELISVNIIVSELSFLLITFLSNLKYSLISCCFPLIINLHFPLLALANFSPKTLIFFSFILIL